MKDLGLEHTDFFAKRILLLVTHKFTDSVELFIPLVLNVKDHSLVVYEFVKNQSVVKGFCFPDSISENRIIVRS